MHPHLFVIPGLNITVPSYGAVVMVGFLLATWLAARRAAKLKVDPDIILNLGFVILIFSTIGARAFYVIHYWDTQFAHQPAKIFNLRTGGMEFYGGFIGAFVACVLYLWIRGYSKRLFADLIAPSLLLAMGIGRIGCFLYGCCWGSTCPASLPWAVRFPYGSPAMLRHWETRQVALPARFIFVTPDGSGGPLPPVLLRLSPDTLHAKIDEATTRVEKAKASGDADKIRQAELQREKTEQALQPLIDHYRSFGVTPAELAKQAQAAEFRSLPVHPAQLYSAVGPILLSFLTGAYLYRRKRHGTVMLVGLGLYAIERFIEEIIRADNPHDTFGLTVSQAISIGILAVVAVAYLILRKLPLRSPRAEASMPKTLEPPAEQATGSAAM